MSNPPYLLLTLASLILFSCASRDVDNLLPPTSFTSATAPQVQTSDLVLTEGTNMAAALSPDGRQLVLDWQGQLWVLPVSGGAAKAILGPLYDARQPDWSPDGKRICFQGYLDGNWHIYSVNSDGSDIKQHTSGVFDHREPQWSTDGRYLFFSSDRASTYDIWRLNPDPTEQEEEWLQITDDEGNEYAPAISADGRQVAYLSDREGKKSLLTQNLSTGHKEVVYTTDAQLFAPAWHPGGQAIVFNQLEFAESRLMAVRQNEEQPVVKVLSKEGEDVFPFRVQWLSENEFVYTSQGRIWRQTLPLPDSEGPEKTNIPFSISVKLDRPNYVRKEYNFDAVTPQPARGIYSPILSPNGRQVAFIALQDVYLQTIGGALEPITQDASVELCPVWSPDGQHLAFISDRSGGWAIWIRDLQSKSDRKLGDIYGSPNGMAWSPDGQTIAYTLGFGPRLGQLWLMDMTTGESNNHSGPIVHEVGVPSWSADGSTIAVSTLQTYSKRFREGIMRILYFAKAGKEKWLQKGLPHWSVGVRGKDGPVWSPDGQYLAAISQGVLWLIPVDSKGRIQEQPIRLTNELADTPSWSADGEYILYQAVAGLKKLHWRTGRVELVDIGLSWRKDKPSGRTIIHAGGLFDGHQNRIQRNVDIVIENNRIVEIAAHRPGRVADRTIDASDDYAMPGLIDIHAHQGSWAGAKLGRQWLAWGVTATRDPATNPYDALNRREATQSGHYVGPRIFFTGSPIDGSRVYYSGTYAQQSPAQLDLELSRAKALDYDMIKTYVRLADPIQQRVVDFAHGLGLPVSSHELYPAVAYGTDGVEHILGTSRRGYSPKMSETMKAYADVTLLLAKSGMSFTPTIGIYISYPYLLAQNPEALQDERLQKLEDPFAVQRSQAQIESVKQDPNGWEKRFRNAAAAIKAIHDGGGLISAGTDGPILPFGFGLHMELEAYQAAGLSSFHALQTATLNNARVLGTEKDMGTVSAGKLADLIIVAANPLEDVRNARKIKWVIKNGRVYPLTELLR